MTQNIQTSTIVSVFNEQNTVSNVVRVLLNCPQVDEVIVVNDGSTDNTANRLEAFISHQKYKYIEFTENKGKSFAMVAGVEEAKGEIVIFIDADLLGLECNHIKQMLKPLLNGEADMVIGPPTENKIDEKLNPFQMLSGERAVYKKDILPLLEKMRSVKYGVELLINLHYKSQGKNIKYEFLWGIYHLIKFRKERLNTSLKNYAIEVKHISRTLADNRPMIFTVLKKSMSSTRYFSINKNKLRAQNKQPHDLLNKLRKSGKDIFSKQ